jgi:SAM-dependent methyltransferase
MESVKTGRYFEAAGRCPICEQDVLFTADGPWFRDQFICPVCNSIPRERALMIVIDRLYPNWRRLSVHESSPSTRGVSPKMQRECGAYTDSQYDIGTPFGTNHPELGYRSENLEAQTFADELFDIVITQDVFEHLFHPDLAIREIARTLRMGGAHICTVPIVRKTWPSRRRAAIAADGSILHLLDPEYHGNPIDPKGSLVTVDWGYDITTYMSEKSGLASSLFVIDDLSRGVRAELIEVVVNRKMPAISI